MKVLVFVFLAIALVACGKTVDDSVSRPANAQPTAQVAGQPAVPSVGTEAATDLQEPLVSLDYVSSEALVIVQQKYSEYDGGWNRLDGARSNGDEIVPALIEQGFQVETLSDQNSQQTRNAIEAFLTRTRPENQLTRLIVYYAGHGDNAPLPDEKGLMGYIIPIDAPQFNFDKDGFWERAIDVAWLRDQALKSTARHTLIILDSCFSSSILGINRSAIKPPDFVQMDELERRAVYVMTASDTVTPDIGPFTPTLIKGIRGAADLEIGGERDGVVTARELDLYVSSTVFQWRRDNPNRSIGTPSGLQLSGFGQIMFGPPSKNRAAPSSTIQSRKIAENSFLFSRPLVKGEQLYLGSCDSSEAPETREERERLATATGRVPISVCYYSKRADESRVTDALTAENIPFQMPRSTRSENEHTDRVICGKKVPVDAVRAVALALHDGGVSLQAIGPYPTTREGRDEMIQIVSHPMYLGEPLSREQIVQMKSCDSIISN